MQSIEVTRKFFTKSGRVKGLDIHPNLPWVLVSIYTGTVQLWNYETEIMVKTFDVSKSPVRDSKFIPKKSWIVCGVDDGMISVYNVNTCEKVTSFEAHNDYIRAIAVHPTLPLILSSSDDCKIKLWDWEKDWKNTATFKGHSDYVMKVTFNPKDPNTFASASSDSTIKMWSINNPLPNFTLEGHREGVNDIDFYHGLDKPFLISGSDDKSVKIWDYLLKSCVHTIERHTYSVTSVAFLPGVPFFVSGSEDGTVRLWDSNTYRMEIALNYGVNRVWCLAYSPKKSEIAIGHDGGTAVVKLGSDSNPVSLDPNGKVAISIKREVRVANLAHLRMGDIQDCEVFPLQYKDLGICELYPQRLIYSSNGRFVAVLGGGEYVIYTSLAWRIKSFGKAVDLAWGSGSTYYAVRESGGVIGIKKNFENFKDFTPQFMVKGVYGGPLLSLVAESNIFFYSWESAACVGRIDISAKNILWSNTEKLALVCDYMVYIVEQNFMGSSDSGSDGDSKENDESDDDAIKILVEIPESNVKSGAWVNETFVYVTSTNKMAYYFDNESTVVATVPTGYNLLGYISKIDSLLLMDKDANAMLVRIPEKLMYLQKLVATGSVGNLVELAKGLSNEHKNQLSKFLESRKMYQLALEITRDDELKFDLALMLNNISIAIDTAEKYGYESMWARIGDYAVERWKYDLAVEAYKKAGDLGSLLILYGSTRDREGLEYVAETAVKLDEPNLALICNFLLSKPDVCTTLLDKFKCHAEAVLMAQTYSPNLLDEMTSKWKDSLVIQKKDTDL